MSGDGSLSVEAAVLPRTERPDAPAYLQRHKQRQAAQRAAQETARETSQRTGAVEARSTDDEEPRSTCGGSGTARRAEAPSERPSASTGRAWAPRAPGPR